MSEGTNLGGNKLFRFNISILKHRTQAQVASNILPHWSQLTLQSLCSSLFPVAFIAVKYCRSYWLEFIVADVETEVNNVGEHAMESVRQCVNICVPNANRESTFANKIDSFKVAISWQRQTRVKIISMLKVDISSFINQLKLILYHSWWPIEVHNCSPRPQKPPMSMISEVL